MGFLAAERATIENLVGLDQTFLNNRVTRMGMMDAEIRFHASKLVYGIFINAIHAVFSQQIAPLKKEQNFKGQNLWFL